ncbi:hypothetical protein CRM22_003730 [Opisthorchis felineus]|uniref:Uncharacterized protein n=1 Tax=Opisthorchis felineus TaxID=147828 RepID=A0A4S2LZV8_OPIFE|nr:hypothetical protein CRM22_003730 [Opisthorchis felineus]
MLESPISPTIKRHGRATLGYFRKSFSQGGRGRTTANTLHQFLLMYCLTPNPSTPEGKSPAEALLYRTLRCTFDLLKSPKEEVASPNQKMESYYNRKHGENWRHFDIEQSVLINGYPGNRVSWSQGKITQRIGTVIYDIHVGSKTWVRHANRLKEAYSQPRQRLNALPLNILIEHLDMNRGRTTDTQVA